MMLGEQYFETQREASFGSYQNLLRVARNLQGVQPSEVKPWLEQQDALYPSQTSPKTNPEELLYRL